MAVAIEQLELSLSCHPALKSPVFVLPVGTSVAAGRVVDSPRRFVYVLRSLSDRTRYYTGVTSNVKARLSSHNAGECVHSARHRPWELDLVMAFRDQARALCFERYLKSGSGVAFAKRHLRGDRS